MSSALRLLALLATALVLVGCGDDDDPVAAGDDTTEPTGAALAEEYVSVEVTEDGQPRPLVPGTAITLRFGDSDELLASLGCNHLRAGYELDGDRLVVDGVGMTEMGCEPELHDQDEWFADLLESEPSLALDGDRLTLASGATVVVFVDREVAEPDASLVGTTWEVDGFADGQDPEDSAMAFAMEQPGRVQFEENGFVTGFDGCNEFGFGGVEGETADGLRYEVDGDRVEFSGDPVRTQVACPDLAEYVERFWAALTGTATWSIDGDQLVLVGQDGRIVTLRAAD